MKLLTGYSVCRIEKEKKRVWRDLDHVVMYCPIVVYDSIKLENTVVMQEPD